MAKKMPTARKQITTTKRFFNTWNTTRKPPSVAYDKNDDIVISDDSSDNEVTDIQ